MIKFQRVKKDEAQGEAPESVGNHAQDLNAQKAYLSGIHQPFLFVKDADSKYGPHTTEPMDL